MLSLDHYDKFVDRHIGPSEADIKEMIKACGVES